MTPALERIVAPGRLRVVDVQLDGPVDASVIHALPDQPAWCWQAPGGPLEIGLGAVLTIEPRDNAAWPSLAGLGERLADVAGVPLVGGRAFSPHGAWPGFPAARFWLPRFWLRHDRLRVVLDDYARATLRDGVARILAHRPRPQRPEAHLVEDMPLSEWRALVAAARANGLAKTVVARRARLCAASAIDAAALLTTLDAPGCVRYLVRPGGGAALVGATPERLVARRGRRISTEALAGTGSDGDALLASQKDRAEHALVVDELRARLTPLCRLLRVPDAPSVRPLRHLVHLATPIEGFLRESLDVLQLGERLHPTPAVAGTPPAAAAAWIARHEPAARGWYAGAIGHVDARGDGELWVALRCALVDAHDAWVYSGAGIVEGSQPDAEYAETAVKRRALFGALGVAS
jgi:isochorismate synthase